MKKLFVSVPMRDRTREAIESDISKMHKIAEDLVGEELELIESFSIENCGQRNDIYSLGKSIVKMANADYVVGTDFYGDGYFRGINIERDVARTYDVPYITVPVEYLGKDIIDIYRKHEETCYPVRNC